MVVSADRPGCSHCWHRTGVWVTHLPSGTATTNQASQQGYPQQVCCWCGAVREARGQTTHGPWLPGGRR